MRLLQLLGSEAGWEGGARAFATGVQAALGGELLAPAGLHGSALAALRQALERTQPEVVLVHLGLAGPDLLMLLRERGIRFAAFLHDFAPICPTQRLWHRRGERCSGPGRTGWKCAWCVSGGAARGAAELPLRTLLYRHRPRTWRTALAGAEALIAPSRFARERWIEEGAPPERIAVIVPPAAAAPAAAPGGGGARRVVFDGGRDEGAGAELLAAALEQLRRPVRLEVVGNGEAAARWRTALGAGAAGHELRPAPPGGWPPLDAAAVVAAPVRYEAAYSPAVAMAQAAGARAVATAVGGLAEQIVHGVNGFLAPPDDPAALAESLEEAFAAPWDAALVAAEAGATAGAALQAVRQLLERIAGGDAAPVVGLEHGAWLERRAAARGEATAEGVRALVAELRQAPVVEDIELALEARQTGRQYKLAMNHALAFLHACGCRRIAVLPAQAPGAEAARAFLATSGMAAVEATELPDGMLELLGEDQAADHAWIRRRFPQLKAYAGVSPAGAEVFADPGD